MNIVDKYRSYSANSKIIIKNSLGALSIKGISLGMF